MSRSYKRVPCSRDSERSRVPNRYKAKTIANRAVRRNEDIPNHGGYRKAYDSWIICDYKFFETEEHFIEEWKRGRVSPRLKNAITRKQEDAGLNGINQNKKKKGTKK